MPVTILSHSSVKQVLRDLSKEDVEAMMMSLETSLHSYSMSTGEDGAIASNQPARIVLEGASGGTTQFMPSITTSSVGMKVATLTNNQDDTTRTDTSAHTVPSSLITSPQGALTILSSTGELSGLINAEELTAFRSALTSCLLLVRRQKVKTITVFGCGKQAFWHVRLALLLRGSTIKHVHFINRDFSDRARNTIKSFFKFDYSVRDKEGWTSTDFSMLTPYFGEYQRLSKDQIRNSDVIFCTTPSTEPLFDHSILTNTEGRQRGRLIIAVGSYKKSMIEIPTEIIAQAVKRHGHGHHLHKRVQEGGVIVVDTLACSRHTGEFHKSGIQANEAVELGELVHLEHDDESPLELEDDTPRGSLDTVRPSLANLSMGDSSSVSTSPRATSISTESSISSKSSESTTISSDSSTQHHHHYFPHLPKIFHKKGHQSLDLTSPITETKEDPISQRSISIITTNNNPRSHSPSRALSFLSRSPRSSSPTRNLSFLSNDPRAPSPIRSLSNSFKTRRDSNNTTAATSKPKFRKRREEQSEKEDEMSSWLSKGNVVYKSIGLGLTDLVVGEDLIRLARRRGIGATIENF